jgi:hypothetical protein
MRARTPARKVYGVNKSLCVTAGRCAVSSCHVGKIYSPPTIPDRMTKSQATVKRRQERCFIKLCHVVLLRVAIFEFCLGVPMRRSSDLQGVGACLKVPTRSSDSWQDNTSGDSVGKVLYGTVAKLPRESQCAEFGTVPSPDACLGE